MEIDVVKDGGWVRGGLGGPESWGNRVSFHRMTREGEGRCVSQPITAVVYFSFFGGDRGWLA